VTDAQSKYACVSVIWQDVIECLLSLWSQQLKILTLQIQIQQITQGIAKAVADISGP